MPVRQMVDLIQHGRRLLIASMSFDMGSFANGWYFLTTTDAPDAEILDAVMTAFSRSRAESRRARPQPASAQSTLESEWLGFSTTSSMESSTTLVGLAMVEGAVVATPFKTVLGRGFSGTGKLDPARGTEQVAARIREALTAAAHASAAVVDHDAIANTQHPDAPASPEPEDDPRVRAQLETVADFAQAVLTRHDRRWAVESVSTMPGQPPVLLPNGWLNTVEATDHAGLAATLVDALARSEDTPAIPPEQSIPLLCDALGATQEQLTSTHATRISVETYRKDDMSFWAQEQDGAGWWQDPEHPDRRGFPTAEPTSLWVRALELYVEDLVTSAPSEN